MPSIDRFRRIADRCRAIPGRFGLHEHSVSIVWSNWDGNALGDGQETTVETPIFAPGGQNPLVKFPSQRNIALSLMSEGEVVIGPVTPKYSSGGTDRSMLDGSLLAAGDSLHIKITGPQCPGGVLYRLRNVDADQAIHCKLICVPAEAS